MKNSKLFTSIFSALSLIFILSSNVFAHTIEYKDSEISVNVTPGEPTQIQFPGIVKGGYMKQSSSLHLDRKDTDLIIFANEGLNQRGESIIVRLEDGRSYSIRIKAATKDTPRDDVVKIEDKREQNIDEEEELAEYKEGKFEYAPSSTVSGFLREMVLVAEFGKKGISGYRVTNSYKGESVLQDGTLRATIDKIFIGPKLWGYVIDVENLLDQSQKLNPATFRLDGTRAISAEQWELSPRPLTIEQEVAKKDKTKVYVVTRARNYR